MTKAVNLTDEDHRQLRDHLDALNDLGIDPRGFLLAVVRAEVTVQRVLGRRGPVGPGDLAGVLCSLLYSGTDRRDPVPFFAPTVLYSLTGAAYRRDVLAEVLAGVATLLRPAQRTRRGRPLHALALLERRVAVNRMRLARLELRHARQGELPLDATRAARLREALALRLDASETAAVLAFAQVKSFTGPLVKVNVDSAVRYFDKARKGK